MRPNPPIDNAHSPISRAAPAIPEDLQRPATERQSARIRSSLPAFTFEKSRMSGITVSRDAPLPQIPFGIVAVQRIELAVQKKIRDVPITPFIGVRISGLMLATKSLLGTIGGSVATELQLQWSACCGAQESRSVRCPGLCSLTTEQQAVQKGLGNS
jgi:hypothetical protein